MTLYRIKDWAEHYENNRTRGLKSMSWLPLQTTYWSNGYTELISSPAGISHFACWITALQVAANCHPRGTLVQKSGIPHTPESISRLTRIPASSYAAAFPVLMEIGWLDCEMTASKVRDGCGESAPAMRDDCAETAPTLHDITLHYITEQTPPSPPGGPADAGLILPLEEAPPKARKKEESPEAVKARWLSLCSQFSGLPPLRKAPNEVSLRGLQARLKENPDFWQEIESSLARFNPERFFGKWPTFAQVVQAKTFENLISGVYSGPSFKSPAAEAAEKAKREADAREAHRKREIAEAMKQEEPTGMPAEELGSKAREWIATRFARPAVAPVPLEEAREKARAALLNGAQR